MIRTKEELIEFIQSLKGLDIISISQATRDVQDRWGTVSYQDLNLKMLISPGPSSAQILFKESVNKAPLNLDVHNLKIQEKTAEKQEKVSFDKDKEVNIF